MQNLLKDCHLGLDKAMVVFGIMDSPAIIDNIGEMKKKAAILAHEELLERIQALSDGDTNSAGSLVYLGANDSRNSSNSFSLLPAKPKIFHGRDSELEDIMQILGQQSVRIAILGGGGMGKTSLAKAVLHHPDVVAKFGQKFFVSAETATTKIELASLIALHVGLNPGKDLTKPVVEFFSRKSPSLLILDNLETVWEPIQSRSGIEEFLSMLTDIEHLTLIITMRGAERPARVQWTHPFLAPLGPLSDEAVQQTFMDITDNIYANEDIHQILRFTDNMPLAVNLIAHLSEYEGLSNVLTRWETEKTALLSVGYDRRSNLDASISLSISSPRITSDSKDLLRLLSILPDGLADAELVQNNLPISNILSCKATLLVTSLAYQDTNKRLRSLMPVREHVQQFLPPSPSLIQSLRNHFHTLLKLYRTYHWDQLHPVVNEINLNLQNLHNVLQCGLHDKAPDVAETIISIISLNSFYRITRGGYTVLMIHLQPILHELDDYSLRIHFITEALSSSNRHHISDPMQCVTQAITLLNKSATLCSNPNSIMQQVFILCTLNWIQHKLCNITKRH
ncbi:P-loop containing nucleoside triphosphate hydrolase protein [Mycena olivaceomarginata]|nr:P-loop containing nucleoside triphosphate hydrolase protein [Mycena olivaceomarginata]